MLRKLTTLAVLLAALAPSAYLAWSLRTMPHLGYYHDDSLYWVSARSLATHHGYRIESLPGQPYQTKYPPLYPVSLALVWKLNPNFPDNLPLATFFAWSALPVFLLALWPLLREYGIAGWERNVVMVLAACSPVTVVFSFSLMAELLFTALLLGAIFFAERATQPEAPLRLAAIAGVLAAFAYLTKSVAAPLLLTVPFCFALRRQFRKGIAFGAMMLPAVAAWQWWVTSHVSHSLDLVTLYYTNYTAYEIYNVPLHDLPRVIWYNLDGFLQGAGKLLIFDLPFGSPYLERVIAVAAIAGCVRLIKRTRAYQYPLAALGISALLLIWHFPPDQRFVFPLYPLLLMGFATEIRNICHAVKVNWKKPAFGDRFAAAGIGFVLALIAAFAVFCNVYALTRFVPDLFASYSADFAARRNAYQWIANNVPAGANVYAYRDPLVFLYTGRRASSLPIPPKFYYHNDSAAIEQMMASTPDFARQQRLQYLLLTPEDYYRDLRAQGTRGLLLAMKSGELQKLYESPGAAVYKLRAAPYAAANRQASPQSNP